MPLLFVVRSVAGHSPVLVFHMHLPIHHKMSALFVDGCELHWDLNDSIFENCTFCVMFYSIETHMPVLCAQGLLQPL